MNIDEGVKTVESFFEKHMNEPQYWVAGDTSESGIILDVSRVDVDADTNEISVVFAVGQYQEYDDPELVALAQGAMAALTKAHPELVNFKLSHELFY
jgi:hypothetical protein